MAREGSPPRSMRHRRPSAHGDPIGRIKTIVASRIACATSKPRNMRLVPADGQRKECKCAILRLPHVLRAI